MIYSHPIQILVEGKSLQVYLQQTLGAYDQSLGQLTNYIENPGGWSQIDKRLGQYYEAGRSTSVFVVWDQDVIGRCGKTPMRYLIDHPLSHSFPQDFEEIFPDWMIVEALASCRDYPWCPHEYEVREYRRAPRSDKSFYEQLGDCMKAHAVSEGGDPTSAKLPSKTKLAESLADVAKRTHYQPKEIRRLYDKLLDLVKTRRESMGLVRSGVNRCGFIINASLADEWRIKGRITLTKVPDLWLFDLDRLVAEKLVENIVAGPPCWDHEGKRIVFSVNPTHNVRNNEVIRIYDLDNGLSEERLRIGHYLCWDKDGKIYGNSLQANGYQIHAIDRLKKNYRRVLPLPNGSILASVDRKNDRVLVGEEGRSPGRICSVYRINDGLCVWDGASVGISLAEYSAGAFSPDGQKVSWPVEEAFGAETTSLWITNIGGTSKGSSKRITPPDGYVGHSCWSPDGKQIAFMWSRWPGDEIRLWVVDLHSGQLGPLVEGPSGVSAGLDLCALGCHSWVQ